MRSQTSLHLLFALAMCAILLAGLWPFHSPRNDVRWNETKDGLRFGRHGVVLTTDHPKSPNPQQYTQPSCSLEIELQADKPQQEGTILGFHDRMDTLRISFTQWSTGVVLRLRERGRLSSDYAHLYVHDVFLSERPVLITITSNRQQTAIYIDGTLARMSAQLSLPCENLSGQLVAGTSPEADDGWRGQMLGLAIYKEALAAAEIQKHVESWAKDRLSLVSTDSGRTVLYLFNEHGGRSVHNVLRSGGDLHIPETYTVADKVCLSMPDGWHWSDIILNILGFIPFGFFLLAILAPHHPVASSAFATTALGAALSLTIETLQVYLPTRDSDLTDVITNTLGTTVGVLLCRTGMARSLITKIEKIEWPEF